MKDPENAVQTLIERMGITKAAIFLRETMSQTTDYLALKDKLFAKESAAGVYDAIKANKHILLASKLDQYTTIF